jgi:N-acetylglucosaminyl-diphospho-decaprenol L-rhamnosyltransferase
MSQVAVVTIARGRHDHLRRQHHSLSAGSRRPDDFVVVAMADPSLSDWPDIDGLGAHVVPLDFRGPLPLAQARNLGAEVALSGGAETLVFLDVDCLAGPDLVSAYEQAVGQFPDTLWSGPVTYLPPGLSESELATPWQYDDPHPARPAPQPGELVHDHDPDLFWSLSFALHADAWRRSGGFCEDYVGYGGEDTDFAAQAAAQGLGLGWVGSARAYHQHHPTQDPPVQHLDHILRNSGIFHRRWGRWPMVGWLREFEDRGLIEHGPEGWVRREAPQRVRG